MMMNTKQRILDEKKVKDFVGDVNKFFEDLAKRYRKDAEEIGNRREYFWRKYPRYSTILQKMEMKWMLMLTPQWRLKVGLS